MARRISLSNFKGGCGKTTTAVILASGLARRGARVLLIDGDPHASATYSLRTGLSAGPTLYDAIMHHTPLDMLVQKTEFKNLWIIPASNNMKELDSEVQESDLEDFGCELAGHEFQIDPDYIIIDTKPSEGKSRDALLLAAEEIVIPLFAEAIVIKGFQGQLDHLKEWAAKRQQLFERDSYIAGVAVTNYNERFASHRTALPLLRSLVEHMGIPFLGCLPVSGAISTAVDTATPIPWSGKLKNFAIWEACQLLASRLEKLAPLKIAGLEPSAAFSTDVTYD